MLARWWTFGVWALVAGSALFWGLRLFVKAPAAPRETVVAQASGGARGDLTRLFGIDAPPPPAEEAPAPVADARFQLIGVVSPRSSGAVREGVALIAVDGKPARAFRVGATVTGDTVLQAVRQRGATLGPRGGPGAVALELAPLPAPATGQLPSIGGDGAPAMPSQPLPAGMRPMRPGMPGAMPQEGNPAADQVQPGQQQNEGMQTR
jgi:general secretion pathway protein C